MADETTQFLREMERKGEVAEREYRTEVKREIADAMLKARERT